MKEDVVRKISERCVTKSTEHMAEEERYRGTMQMIDDLESLASGDGCVAAAWAIEVIQSLAGNRLEDLLTVNLLQGKIDDLDNVVQMLRCLKGQMLKK